MTLPTPKDIADKLILERTITAELFLQGGACAAGNSTLPWKYLVTNYYQQHKLADAVGEITQQDIDAVRDAVFTGVITDIVTSPDFRDIVRTVYKGHELTSKDISIVFDPRMSKWRVVKNDAALEAIRTLESILNEVHLAALVAHYSPKTVPDPDEVTACLAMTIYDVLIDDDMEDYIANGA